MSGMPRAASTIPGGVGTLTSCFSESPPRTAASSSASANSRAGTRMSARASAGISHSSSSMRSSGNSDIEYHPGAVPRGGGREREAVIGHRLDEVRRLTQAPADGRPQRVVVELEGLEAQRLEALRLGQEHELLEPGGQQRRAVRGVQLDGARLVALAGGAQQVGQGDERVGEDRAL